MTEREMIEGLSLENVELKATLEVNHPYSKRKL